MTDYFFSREYIRHFEHTSVIPIPTQAEGISCSNHQGQTNKSTGNVSKQIANIHELKGKGREFHWKGARGYRCAGTPSLVFQRGRGKGCHVSLHYAGIIKVIISSGRTSANFMLNLHLLRSDAVLLLLFSAM